jgi:hypothetical protein
MPRKLPWAMNGTAIKTELKRQTTPEALNTIKSEPESSHRGRSRKTNLQRRPRSQSHSTSPPPGPPSVEPMKEGFEEDDIWMIVEDEFEALAKTFTAHLHHAEYKKLVKRARDAPGKSLPTAASPMSKDTIRRIQRDNLRHRQNAAVDGLATLSSLRNADENVEDPWRGTSIAGLIASGSQGKRSLKGIDRLPSSTRAAQGFARPGSSDGLQSEPQAASTAHSRGAIPMPQKPLEERIKPTNHLGHAYRGEAESPGPQRTPEHSALPRPTISKFPVSATGHGKPGVKRPPMASLLAKRKKLKTEDSREERLSQVPMFLI